MYTIIDALTAFYVMDGENVIASIQNDSFSSKKKAKKFAENVSRIPELVKLAKDNGVKLSEPVYENEQTDTK